MFIKDKNTEMTVKNNVDKVVIYTFLMIFGLLSGTMNAQCAMCRAALTSEGNVKQAAAVNDGIVYLMVIPYILVAGIGYAIYRMKKKKTS